MSSKIQVAALIGALVASVHAHGHIDAIKVDGTDFTAYDPSFQYQNPPPEVIEWSCPDCQDNGFVSPDMYTDVTKIACHKNAKTGAKVATVKAGGTVDLQWSTWPESHVGPVIDYLAPVADATAATAADLSFFKIDEAGFEGGEWAAIKLLKNNLTWSVTIPSNIKAGDYVLRHEIIALHSAGSEGGAQNYPKCVNLRVEGTGTETPAGVTADKLYTPTDPGIKVSVYGDNSAYKIPGPAVFGGASAGSPAVAQAVSSIGASTAATPSPAAPAAPLTTGTTGAAKEFSLAQFTAWLEENAASAAGQEFTLETFTAWLKENAGSVGSSARRARALRV